MATEPAPFNDYVIAEEKKVMALRGRIRKLKADCEKVCELRDALNAQGKTKDWKSMWRLLGKKAAKRATELERVLPGRPSHDRGHRADVQGG
jgi:hypothetical protein